MGILKVNIFVLLLSMSLTTIVLAESKGVGELVKCNEKVAKTGVPPADCPAKSKSTFPDNCNYPFEKKCLEAIDKRGKKGHPFIDNSKKQVCSALGDFEKSLSPSSTGALAVKFLKTKGIIEWNLTEEQQKDVGKALLEGNMIFSNLSCSSKSRELSNKFYAAFTPPFDAECRKFKKHLPAGASTVEKMKHKAEMLVLIKKMQTKERSLLSGSTSVTDLFNTLARSCETVKRRKIDVKFCSKESVLKLKYKTLDLYAAGASDEGKKKIATFKNELVDKVQQIRHLSVKSTDHELRDICMETGKTLKTLIRKGMFELRESLVHSKPFVRSIEKRFLADDIVSSAKSLFKSNRDEILSFFKKEIAPASGLPSKVTNDYAKQLGSLELKTPEKIPESSFQKSDEFPFKTVDPDFFEEVIPISKHPLADPSLAGMIEFNAAYHPTVSMGKTTLQEGVLMLPTVLLHAKNHPQTMNMLMGHEIGHKIDPDIAEVYGLDLSKAYKKLFACMKDKMNITEDQNGEAFADWMSATINAKKIAKITDSKKKLDFAEKLVENFCIEKSDTIITNIPGDPHPMLPLRRMKIFGLNPDIRKAIGCSCEPYCSLKGEEKCTK